MRGSVNSMEIQTGHIVRALAGHDSGELYCVIATEGDFLLLADGILNLITVLTAVKIIQNQYPDAIDADYTEADE